MFEEAGKACPPLPKSKNQFVPTSSLHTDTFILSISIFFCDPSLFFTMSTNSSGRRDMLAVPGLWLLNLLSNAHAEMICRASAIASFRSQLFSENHRHYLNSRATTLRLNLNKTYKMPRTGTEVYVDMENRGTGSPLSKISGRGGSSTSLAVMWDRAPLFVVGRITTRPTQTRIPCHR